MVFVAEIKVTLEQEADPDEIYLLLGSLRQNGQILSREFPIVQTGQTLKAVVLIPEADSLNKAHDNKWVRRGRVEIAKKGLTRLRATVFGPDPTSQTNDQCESPNEYILFTNYLTLESALRCGHCFDPVPLYRVPPTYDDSEYYDVIRWQSDYQACDTLQMGCSTGERFGIREMSEANSSLSRRGRKVCSEIEASTGKPVYYYLFRYVRRTTSEKEEARPCPLCGGAWLLEEPWHIFDFKCEACRLVSTLSPLVA